MTKPLQVGLDWLSFVGSSARIEELKNCNVDRWGEPEPVERGGCSYQRQLRWASGVILFYSDGRDDCLLACPGQGLAVVNVDEQLRLLRQLHGLGFHTSRVDCKVDDFARSIELDQVHAAADAGNFTNFRLTQPIQPKRIAAGGMEKVGDSRTFGRRGSDGSGVYYRVYDKLLESKGEVDCIRWEAEFGGEKAREVGRLLADCEDARQLVEVVGQLVGGHIDFRIRGDETHVDRRPRLAWWAEFLERIGSAVISIARVTPPLQSALRQLGKQYRSTLGQALVICKAAGVDLLGHLRELAEQAASELDPRRLDRRDNSINLSEAFNLARRQRAFVPLAVLRDWQDVPF